MTNVSWYDPWPYWEFEEMRRAARIAVTRTRVHPAHFVGDPADVAWEGVALAVAENPQCSWYDAVKSAQNVLAADMRHARQSVGSHTTHTGQKFWLFWNDLIDEQQRQLEPEQGLTKMVVQQLIERLPQEHYETLVGVVAHKTVKACAQVWGIPTPTAQRRVAKARTAAMAILYDWETPPRLRRLSEGNRIDDEGTCTNGHDRNLYEVVRFNKKRERVRSCSECSRIRGHRRRSKGAA